MTPFPHIIACPVCSAPLSAQQTHWDCPAGHSFDQARQGYLNLLVAQHKKSKAPGDTLEMVDARQRVLDSNLYQPISDLLNQWVSDIALTRNTPLQIADIGCGEGYYTQRLQQTLADHQVTHNLYGIDISKNALRRAAKRSKDIYWLVGSGGQPPFLANQLDLITCLFTNLMPEGFAKVLKPNATVILVNTGLDHLIELRQRVYENVKSQAFDPSATMLQHGYELNGEQKLKFKTKLTSSQQIIDLLQMTPHWWRVQPSALAKLEQLDELEITVDITLHQFTNAPQQDERSFEWHWPIFMY